MQQQELEALAEEKARVQQDLEQRIIMLTRENQGLAASLKDAERHQAQADAHSATQSAALNKDALMKMEELVQLNDDLMKSNAALQGKTQQQLQSA